MSDESEFLRTGRPYGHDNQPGDTLVPDRLSDVERALVVQRRAVLLYGGTPGLSGAMAAVSRAAARLSMGIRVLDAKPQRCDDWLYATPHERIPYWDFYTPLSLAYADKYPDERATDYSAAPTEAGRTALLANLLGVTRNASSHAWSFFAPIWRGAPVIFGIAPIEQLSNVRPLIELICPLDQCVVDAPGYENLRLG